MATQRTLSIFTNEDKPYTFTVYGVGTITPTNITGWTLSFSVKALATDDTASFSKTVGDGIVLTTPTSGLCTVTVDAADTADLEEGIYRYELKRTTAGSERVLFYGRFRVTRSVH